MEVIVWFIIILVILIWVYLAFFWGGNRKKLSKDNILKYNKILKNITNDKSISNSQKIIDYDKLYHKILLSVQYSWTFWDILKQKPLVISDLNKIWELHKLRNKLSHDFLDIDEEILQKKSNEYKNEISNLLKKLS